MSVKGDVVVSEPVLLMQGHGFDLWNEPLLNSHGDWIWINLRNTSHAGDADEPSAPYKHVQQCVSCVIAMVSSWHAGKIMMKLVSPAVFLSRGRTMTVQIQTWVKKR